MVCIPMGLLLQTQEVEGNMKMTLNLHKYKREILNFIFNAPQGQELKLKGVTLKKDFTIEDLGFRQIKPNYYVNDEGKILSKAYVEELIWESITTEPEAWLS